MKKRLTNICEFGGCFKRIEDEEKLCDGHKEFVRKVKCALYHILGR